MAQNRPAIPAGLKRAVYVEAGHRCAIPTCRQVPVDIAHIIPWEQVGVHEFDNLIALCPTCHRRYDRDKEIDRKAMLQYKENLGILSNRYTQIELQLLRAFVRQLQEMKEDWSERGFPPYRLEEPGSVGFENLRIYEEMWWVVSNLLDDGLIELRKGESGARLILLTQKGRMYLVKWIDADPVDSATFVEPSP